MEPPTQERPSPGKTRKTVDKMSTSKEADVQSAAEMLQTPARRIPVKDLAQPFNNRSAVVKPANRKIRSGEGSCQDKIKSENFPKAMS